MLQYNPKLTYLDYIMPNHIILIISHSPLSTNKMLLRSIQQKGFDTKFAMLINYTAKSDENDRPLFNLDAMINTKISMSAEEQVLLSSLPPKENVYTLDVIKTKYFDALIESPIFVNRELSSAFEFHLFVELNLTVCGGAQLTTCFHDSVHGFGEDFLEKFAAYSPKYNVYAYSQTPAACEAGNRYFNGEIVDGLQLNIRADSTCVGLKNEIVSLMPNNCNPAQDLPLLNIEQDSYARNEIKKPSPTADDTRKTLSCLNVFFKRSSRILPSSIDNTSSVEINTKSNACR